MVKEFALKIFHPLHVSGLKRLGNKFDGGYVVHYPSLKKAGYLLNYGVGYNVEFEKDFFKVTGLPTLAFDPTLKSLALVFKRLPEEGIRAFLRHAKNYASWLFQEKKLKNYNITFVNEGLSDKDLEQYKSLAYHVKKYDLADKKFILKIDIEGAEFRVFNDPGIYNLLPNAVQILMEIHSLEGKMENLIEIMEHIAHTHTLVHIHSNNHSGTFKYNGKNVPDTIEVTFLANEFVTDRTYSTTAYPIPELDSPCDKSKKDIVLDFFL